MKKRYIFGLVMLALFALAGTGTVVYWNWDDIKDFLDVSSTDVNERKRVKGVNVVDVKPDKTVVIQKNIEQILDTPKDDPKLKKDLGNIRQAKTSADTQIAALTTSTLSNIKKENEVVKKKAPKLASIVVDNAKKIEIQTQKNASAKYAALIKAIEREKMKASVFLTGNITEKEKIAKINNLDMEIELIAHNKLGADSINVRKVWTKEMAANAVMKDEL